LRAPPRRLRVRSHRHKNERMHRIFGSSSRRDTPQARTPAVASQMHEALDLIDKRTAHVERLIQREIDAAREHAARGNQRAALECIKRKKIHDKERDQLGTQRLNLMQQEQTLNALRFNSMIVDVHAAGTAAIEREIKKVNGVEGVERVHDKLDEALADAADVLGASSRVAGSAQDADDDELLEELEQLALVDELSKTSNSPTVDHLSEFARVPQTHPVVSQRRAEAAEAERRERAERAELAELEAKMKIEQPMPMPMMAACC